MIRSTPTTYKGVRFASALEADWAKTLDALTMVWQYEPDGLVLPGGAWYRPDFHLPRIGVWLEVKGPHNQRIGKPGRLAGALTHADGCKRGTPETVLARPASVQAAGCPCGYGPDFPYRPVVIGRPATSGRMTFEPAECAGGRDQTLAVLRCPHCKQHSFADLSGAPICRRCHLAVDGAPCHRSGTMPFQKVVVPIRHRRPAHMVR